MSAATATATETETNNRITVELGRVVETRGVHDWLEKDGRRLGFVRRCFRRYCRADWGDTDESDRRENDAALTNGRRIFSAYRFQGRKVWIITEAENDEGRREYTTIIFPSEY